jgi:hypothetical protein
MSNTMHKPRWRRLIDGGRSWGSLTILPSRYGVTRHHLVVYPPGISADERTLLRLWRSWPIWGMPTWLILEMFLVPTIGSNPALAISTSLCLGAGALLMAMTGANRTRVRTLTVVRMAGVVDAVAVDRYAELYALAYELAEADCLLEAGTLSTVDHEAVVWRVYDRLSTPVPA